MNKKDYFEKYQKGELNPKGVIPISNSCSIEILEIEYGTDDRVIGVYNGTDIFKRKLYYTNDDIYFKLGSIKHSLGEAILTYQG